MSKRKPDVAALSFQAAFAPNRKAFQMDTDGEATIVLVVPPSDALIVTAAFQALREEAFTVTLTNLST